NDHGAAREFLKRVFQRTEGFHVQVVSRLIEQNQVSALFQSQRQVQAVALTTGENLGWLLLVRPLETECGKVCTRRHFVLAYVNVVQTFRDYFPDGCFGIDVCAVLVNIGQLNGVTNINGTRIWLFQAHNRLEQGSLTNTVGTNDANDAIAWQGKGQILNQSASVKALGQVLSFNNLVAQAWWGRNLDFFKVQLLVLLSFSSHLFVALQTRLVLSLTCLCTRTNPCQLILQALAQLGILLASYFQTLSLLLQVGGVVALVWVELAAVDLTDPARYVIKEVTVVSNSQDSTRVVFQVLFQPLHRFSIQVVSRLVEQQQVWLTQQQLRQSDTAAFTTGKLGNWGIRRRAAQCFHRLLNLGIYFPCIRCVEFFLQLAHFIHELIGVVGGHFFRNSLTTLLLFEDVTKTFFNVFTHCFFFIQSWFLLQNSDGGTWIQESLAIGRLV